MYPCAKSIAGFSFQGKFFREPPGVAPDIGPLALSIGISGSILSEWVAPPPPGIIKWIAEETGDDENMI